MGLRLPARVMDVHARGRVSEITRDTLNRGSSRSSLQIEEPPIAVRTIASGCSRMQDSEELTPRWVSGISKPSRSNTG